jgi:hypothetical protein
MTTAIHRAFLWVNRHPRFTWTSLLVYSAVVTFPHEQVQTVVGHLAKALGRASLYRWAAGIALTGGIFLSLLFIQALRCQTKKRLAASYWIATLLLIGCAWRLLTANNTELVHYPQYFVPGAILMAVTLSPFESLSWITITGGLDECYQYWGLHGGWGVPFDFNDVFMDFLGGALGVVFAIAFLSCKSPEGQRRFARRIFSKPGAALLAAIVASGSILWACGKMLLYQDAGNHSYWFALSRMRAKGFWFFDDTWGPKTFHTLSPLEGPALLILALAFYGALDWKFAISAPAERL